MFGAILPRETQFDKYFRCLLVVAALVISGCATLSHGSTQSLQAVSDPPGAQITVDDDPVPYVAPATITFKRGQDHVLVFRKSGFQDYRAELTRSTSGAVFGNFILGGMTGLITDYGSGSAFELGNANLANGTLTVRLPPISSSVPGRSASNPVSAGPKSAAGAE